MGFPKFARAWIKEDDDEEEQSGWAASPRYQQMQRNREYVDKYNQEYTRRKEEKEETKRKASELMERTPTEKLASGFVGKATSWVEDKFKRKEDTTRDVDLAGVKFTPQQSKRAIDITKQRVEKGKARELAGLDPMATKPIVDYKDQALGEVIGEEADITLELEELRKKFENDYYDYLGKQQMAQVAKGKLTTQLRDSDVASDIDITGRFSPQQLERLKSKERITTKQKIQTPISPARGDISPTPSIYESRAYRSKKAMMAIDDYLIQTEDNPEMTKGFVDRIKDVLSGEASKKGAKYNVEVAKEVGKTIKKEFTDRISLAKKVPFAGGFVEAGEMQGFDEAMNVFDKVERGEKLNEREGDIYTRYLTYIVERSTPRGFGYELGTTLAQMPTYALEFALLGGLVGDVGGVAAKGVSKITAGQANKLATTIVSQAVESSLRSAAYAPKISAKMSEYMLPEYQLVAGKNGDKILNKMSEGDTKSKAFWKAMGNIFVETLSEDVGKYINLSGMSNKALDRLAQKAVIGKWASKIKVPSRDVGELAKRMGFNGIINEVIEEEFAEFFQAPLEGRAYTLPLEVDANGRLNVNQEAVKRFTLEFLSSAIFGGLMNGVQLAESRGANPNLPTMEIGQIVPDTDIEFKRRLDLREKGIKGDRKIATSEKIGDRTRNELLAEAETIISGEGKYGDVGVGRLIEIRDALPEADKKQIPDWAIESLREETDQYLAEKGKRITSIVKESSKAKQKKVKPKVAELKVPRETPKKKIKQNIESSVLQIKNTKTGNVTFKTIKKGELSKFKNLVDNTQDKGIAGVEVDGKIFQLTAKTPAQMIKQKASYTGVASAKTLEALSRRVVEANKKPTPSTEALEAEARKYKSAEEFVSDNLNILFTKGNVPSIAQLSDNTKIKGRGGTKLLRARQTMLSNMEDAILEKDKSIFQKYKELPIDQLKKKLDESIRFADERNISRSRDTLVLPRIIEAKQQLTDIWNKAKGLKKGVEGTDLMAEARKYKSAEEFVKSITLVDEVRAIPIKQEDRSLINLAIDTLDNTNSNPKLIDSAIESVKKAGYLDIARKLELMKGPLGRTKSTFSKSQLTDLYNQATKLTRPTDPTEALIQEARKYKSAEEFVKAQIEPTKKGYIRLYKGMYGKFREDFDLSRTKGGYDVPYGYSTWTDSKKLAEQYGDNVYRIDLPLSKMADLIVDNLGEINNPLNRGLFLYNKEKAGLNGVSGDEYLIYTDHKDYSPKLVKEVKTKSQLEYIWNEANRQLSLPEQTPKPVPTKKQPKPSKSKSVYFMGLTKSQTPTKSDHPLWFNKKKINTWDSDAPVQFVSGDRPSYKRHIDGYVGDISEWVKKMGSGFYDIFGELENIPKAKIDSTIEKSFYDAKNNLLVTKSHNSIELNRAIENYVEQKEGISFADYKKLPSKKPKIQKTREEIFIDQLKTAQKYSDLAKTDMYNAGIIKRNIEGIERSNWQGPAMEKELSRLEKELDKITNFYTTKQSQIENSIINSNKLGYKPIISLDESGVPVVYFETPKGQVSFHIPNYGEYDFNSYNNVSELVEYLPKKIIDNVKLVDHYKWSGLQNSDEIIDALIPEDFIKTGNTGVAFMGLTKSQTPTTSYLNTEFKKMASREQIASKLYNDLDLTMKRRGVKRGAMGQFLQGSKLVRYKKGGINTKVHEAFHYLQEQIPELSQKKIKDNKIIYNELYKIGKETGYKPALTEPQLEGFAVWGDLYINNPALAKDVAPNLTKYFDNEIATLYPEIHNVLSKTQEDVAAWRASPPLGKVRNSISYEEQKVVLPVKDKVKRFAETVYTSMFERYYPLQKFENLTKDLEKITPDARPFVLARLARDKGLEAAKEFLDVGTIEWDLRKVIELDKKGNVKKVNHINKGLLEIIRPLKTREEQENFSAYLAARRKVAFMKQKRNIETPFTTKEAIEAIKYLEKENPRFRKMAREVYAYNKDLLKYIYDAGLIDLELYKKLNKDGLDYVPFYRVVEGMEKGGYGTKKIANQRADIKRIRGSERDIIDPIEGMMKNTYRLITASNNNSVMQAMAALVEKHPEVAHVFTPIPLPQAKVATVTPYETIRKQLTAMPNPTSAKLLEVFDAIDLDLEEAIDIFRPSHFNKDNIVFARVNGKTKAFDVEPQLYKALMGYNSHNMTSLYSLANKILGLPARTLRAGATITPDFMLRNLLRDTLTATTFAKYRFLPGIDTLRGLGNVLQHNEAYNAWRLSGGSYAELVATDRPSHEKIISDLRKSKKHRVIERLTPQGALETLRDLSSVSEQSTRTQVFENALKESKDPYIAALDAREATLDFNSGGWLSKEINRFIPFFNAGMQGMKKIGQAFYYHPKETTLRSLMYITLPSIYLWSRWKDDERYKELEDSVKNNFWVLGFTSEDEPVLIPKPFEMGLMFGSAPERFMEFIDERDPDTIKAFVESLAEAFNVTPDKAIPQAIKPFIENWANQSFFWDTPIVPTYKEGYEEQLQYSDYTSDTLVYLFNSKVADKLPFKVSPGKFENIWSSYTGGLGRYALNASDAILKGTGLISVVPPPERLLSETAITKAFIKRPVSGYSTKSVRKFYDTRDDLAKREKTFKAFVEDKRKEEAKEYARKNPDLNIEWDDSRQDFYSMTRRAFDATSREMSDLSSTKRKVKESANLTPKEKREKIKELDRLIQEVAKHTYEGYYNMYKR